MQKLAYGFLAASLLATAAPQVVWAQSQAAVVAKLAAPVSEPRKVIIDGRLWRCEGDTCKGAEVGDSQSIKRECARVVKALGPVVAYRNGHRTLEAADIAACNGKDAAAVAQAAAQKTQ